MRLAWPAAALLLVLAGCVDHWAKPGATKAELDAATAHCETDSFSKFPAAMVTTLASPGYLAPLRTECRAGRDGRQVCYTVGGEFVPPVYTTVDANAQPRRASFRGCMVSGGWTLARDREEAEAIARSGSPMTMARDFCEGIFKRAPNAAMMAVLRNNFERCVEVRTRDLGRAAK